MQWTSISTLILKMDCADLALHLPDRKKHISFLGAGHFWDFA